MRVRLTVVVDSVVSVLNEMTEMKGGRMSATLNDRRTEMEERLGDVRELMARALGQTVLNRLPPGTERQFLGTGKMLRSRLLFRAGDAAVTPVPVLLHSAAAVELIHAASLLHDDVIDGGFIRRNLPAFWVERGIPGAILVGDLMLFKALELLGETDDGRLMAALVKMTGEVCDAESEQELFLRGKQPTWENCVTIARRKTGALFAFAAYAAGGADPALSAALQEAGYAIGTAYQLADDILDVVGTEGDAGKTLGTDHMRCKTTAASAAAVTGVDPVLYIELLLQEAEDILAPWPAILRAWRQFADEDLRPAVNKSLAAYAAG